uniref:Uncharacterized protein n=1 Tax=Arundo donax TaxID=35708 RepID=A0A0A9I003_ARUDO
MSAKSILYFPVNNMLIKARQFKQTVFGYLVAQNSTNRTANSTCIC